MRDRLFDLHGIIEGEYYPGTFLIGISKKFFNGMKYSDFTTCAPVELYQGYGINDFD